MAPFVNRKEGVEPGRETLRVKTRALRVGEQSVVLVATIALAGVIASYASLLPLGKWHPDEFTRIHVIQAYGWHQVVNQIFGWAPRPVSELVLWAYAAIVTWTGKPNMVAFLAALWAAMLFGLYYAAQRNQRHPALIATVLVAAFLLLEKPGEMFYWPVGAAAYVLGVGSLGIACILTAEPRPRPWLLGAALVCAAWCSEVTAIAVLIYAAFLLIAHLSWPRRVRISWPMWSVAMAAALFPIVITVLYRGKISEVMLPGSPTVGSLWLSLIAALPEQLHELVTARLGAGWWGIPIALAVKLLLFLGFRALAADRKVDADASIRSVLLGLALLLTSYGSLALSYDKFGVDCCERHETVRATLVVLALYSFAQAWPMRRSLPLRAGILALPLLAVFCWRVPDLIYDHGLIAPTLSNRSALWRSGNQPGPIMVWTNAPIPRIADGDWALPPGTYTRTSETSPDALDWRDFAVMSFFGKHVLTVLPQEPRNQPQT
jgi:hypothetical protein